MNNIGDILVNLLSVLSHGIPGLVVAGVALILMFFGLIRKESSLMIIAAFLTIPVTYTAGGWNGLLLFVRLMPLSLLISAFAISRDDGVLAWAFSFPSFGALAYFLFNLVLFAYRGI
jgi:hypothetical protein